MRRELQSMMTSRFVISSIIQSSKAYADYGGVVPELASQITYAKLLHSLRRHCKRQTAVKPTLMALPTHRALVWLVPY